jgi:hypothetical protein
VNAIGGTITVSSQEQWAPFMAQWFQIQSALNAAGWAGILEIGYPTALFVYTQVGLPGAPPLPAISDAAAIIHNISSQANVTPILAINRYPTWYTAFIGAVSPVIQGSTVNINV